MECALSESGPTPGADKHGCQEQARTPSSAASPPPSSKEHDVVSVTFLLAILQVKPHLQSAPQSESPYLRHFVEYVLQVHACVLRILTNSTIKCDSDDCCGS